MVLLISLLLPIILLLLLLNFIVRPCPVTIPVRNRHVFVTGGSMGIGLAIAKQAASEGARRISLLALDQLEQAKQSIHEAYEVEVSIFPADVCDYNAIKRAVNEAGPIDVLVVNHGVYYVEELEKQGLDIVKKMIDVNLMGSFNVIKAALPLMKKDRKDKGPASIALMSSTSGQVGTYGLAAYSATKFGLRGLAEALQQEVLASPKISRMIDESLREMEAEEVAKIAMEGIKSGSFVIPCRFKGRAVAIAAAGFSPQRSFFMASIEVIFAGLFRLVALLLQRFFYWIIEGNTEL